MQKRNLVTKTVNRCQCCGKESFLISRSPGVCLDCIRHDFAKVEPLLRQVHHQAREAFGLPPELPQEEGGAACHLCFNECRAAHDSRSYCGLRINEQGKLKGASAEEGNVSWYHDPLPTNCVADWVCPGGTGAGYPEFAYSKGPEYGYKNLAVFYQACSFDCLFCQNWHYRRYAAQNIKVSASRLAEAVDEHISCICFFGGDPSPQLPHALRVSRIALEKNKGRILRICWETNGSMHPALLRQAAEFSLSSGGCIKFDLKAWSPELHVALCGVDNERTLANFQFLASYIERRPSPPFLVASTLLVPGYIDREEVFKIASFISSLNPEIPYALLAFHPDFLMTDLPTTTFGHAQESYQAAKAAGLKRVRLGNIHLLRDQY